MRVPSPPSTFIQPVFSPLASVMDELEDTPNRDQRITLRVTEAERAAIEEAAAAVNRSISAHIRQSASDSAAAQPRVPPINRKAWQKLAPVASNLNQLAAHANEFRARFADREPCEDWAKRAARVYAELEELADNLRGRVARLRRSLYGSEPLELAVDVLEHYRRAAQTGELDVDADRLDAVIEVIHDVADDLEEAS